MLASTPLHLLVSHLVLYPDSLVFVKEGLVFLSHRAGYLRAQLRF